MQKLRREVIVGVLHSAFGTEFSNVFSRLSLPKLDTIEVEARITNYGNHCSIDTWNSYDGALILQTSTFDDYVQTIDNPKLKLPNTHYRRYVIGGGIQMKTLISRFSTHPSISLTPLLFKFSEEIDLSSLGDIENEVISTCHLFRQSFGIRNSTIMTHLSNWRVDKSVRFIVDGDHKYIPTPVNFTMNKPVGYTFIDIEFEYRDTASIHELNESVVDLIEFINSIDNPKLYSQLSPSYILFERMSQPVMSKERLFGEYLILSEDPIDKKPLSIPSNSEYIIMVYINDDNWFTFSNDWMNTKNLKPYSGEPYSVISGFIDNDENIYSLDIAIHDSKNITNLNIEERESHLNELVKSSKIFTNNFNGEDRTYIYKLNEFGNLRYLPHSYRISFRLSLHQERDFYLLTPNDTPFISPFIHSKLFTPQYGRNDFEDEIDHNKISFDKSIVEFEVNIVDGRVQLIPIGIGTKVTPSIEASHIMSRAYYASIDESNRYIRSEISEVNCILQYSIEQSFESTTAVNSCVFVPSSSFSNCQSLLNIASMMISSENMIVQGSSMNILLNIDDFYNNDSIRPISTNISIVTNPPKIIAINENTEISSIGEFFKNSMNAIITPFLSITSIDKFISLIDYINRNKARKCTLLLNVVDGVVMTYRGNGVKNNENEIRESPFNGRLDNSSFLDSYTFDENGKYKHHFSRTLLQKLALMFDLTIHSNADPYTTISNEYWSMNSRDMDYGANIGKCPLYSNRGVLLTKELLSKEDIRYIMEQAKVGWIVVVTDSPIYITSVKRLMDLQPYVYSSIEFSESIDGVIPSYIYQWIRTTDNPTISELMTKICSLMNLKNEIHRYGVDSEFLSTIERDFTLSKSFFHSSTEMDLSNLVSMKISL